MVFLLKSSTQFAVWDLPHERSNNTILKTFPSLPIASRMKSSLLCTVLEVLCHLLSYLLSGLAKKHNCHWSHTAILMPSPVLTVSLLQWIWWISACISRLKPNITSRMTIFQIPYSRDRNDLSFLFVLFVHFLEQWCSNLLPLQGPLLLNFPSC